ncbi:MAG: ATP-binding protein [Candidatus Zixiibacteriota bacterium]
MDDYNKTGHQLPSRKDEWQQSADNPGPIERIPVSENLIDSYGPLFSIMPARAVAVIQSISDIHSSLVPNFTLKIALEKAIHIFNAERGFIQLFDENDHLQMVTEFDFAREAMTEAEYLRLTNLALNSAITGESIISETVLCANLRVNNKPIGVFLINGFPKAEEYNDEDLAIFDLLVGHTGRAYANAGRYDELLNINNLNSRVIKDSPVGVIIVDQLFNLLSINDSALMILDKNRAGLKLGVSNKTPDNLMSLLSGSDYPKWKEMFDSVKKFGKPFNDPRYLFNSGYDEKTLSIKIKPVDNVLDYKPGLMILIEDITDMVILEKYLILSEKLAARGEMASAIAHEMNNYLSIISNNAELLIYNIKRGNFANAQKNSRQITETIQRTKKFTYGLMDFSKMEAEYYEYDIPELIVELVSALTANSKFKDIDLVTNFEENLPKVEVDVGQIQQVILNMMINSAEALEARSQYERKNGNPGFRKAIEIDVERVPRGEKVNIRIKDNGIGIPEECHNNIFRLHFTTKETGHGIGLNNCKQIISNHHGDIIFESKINVGTTFIISLPEKQPESDDTPKLKN